MTVCTRSRAPILDMARLRWLFTVLTSTTRAAAISALDMPWASSLTISASRAVSASAVPAAGRGADAAAGELADHATGDRLVDQALAGGDPPDGVDQVVGFGVLEQEAAGARLERA